MVGQPKIPPTPPGTSLAGKTAIITGGNSGLGLEAARQFLVLGISRVILACRSVAKAQNAVESLRADPEVAKHNPHAAIDVFELDLDDYKSGLRFAEKVKKEVPELDILLNNGGMAMVNFEQSKSGHERIMQVNCYTHVLITLELLPLLHTTAAKRGSPTRVSFTGSALHLNTATWPKTLPPLLHDDSKKSLLQLLDDKATFSSMSRYSDSKLAVASYVSELAKIAPPSEVIINHLCPGLVQTGFDKDLPFHLKYIMILFRKIYGRDVVAGGRTLVHATVVVGPESHGKFVQNAAVSEGSPWLNEPDGKIFTERLWKETVQDVATVDPALGSYA